MASLSNALVTVLVQGGWASEGNQLRSPRKRLPRRYPSGPEPACLDPSSREVLGRGGFPLRDRFV